jgi:predicted 3-demethylubiquinone-9 3-methyltransferase (glyoxalase superfamily)
MPQINTFLTFNNQAEEAARFYTSIFPNSKITRITRYPDLGPQSPFKAGSVMTVEFTLDGCAFTALNGGPQFTFSQGFSVAVLCDTQQEVDEYWDKFVTDPDPAKAGKAMQAMMTMIKIDTEQLKRALAK